MPHVEPTSKAEYDAMYLAGTHYFGHGLQTGMSVPCPFCCAPGFLSWRILEVEEAMSKDTTCGECMRTLRTLFRKDAHGKSFEMVQTGGPDCIRPWIPPIRRIDK